MVSTILIIGGGQAGAQAVDTLRREGYAGRITLIGDEPHLPYQRPPLSKKYLAGEFSADRLPFRHRAIYDQHRVELKLGVGARRLDRARRRVVLEDETQIDYDRLILCVGAKARPLTCPGSELAGVHYLRGIADVAAIREDLETRGAGGHHRRRVHRTRDCSDRPSARLQGHRARNGGPPHEPSRGIERLGVLATSIAPRASRSFATPAWSGSRVPGA